LLEDIRFASRQLRKSPGFSIVAVSTLALAIGAGTTIFSAVDAVLLHPLPYPDPDGLMVVTENLPHYGLAGSQPSFSEFLEYRRLETCFSQIAAVEGVEARLTGEGQPEDADGKRVTSGAFPMLGIKPIMGGLFTVDDEKSGQDHVGFFRRACGNDGTGESRPSWERIFRLTGRATVWPA
jgi:putative ABC transport system permease protein